TAGPCVPRRAHGLEIVTADDSEGPDGGERSHIGVPQMVGVTPVLDRLPLLAGTKGEAMDRHTGLPPVLTIERVGRTIGRVSPGVAATVSGHVSPPLPGVRKGPAQSCRRFGVGVRHARVCGPFL